jgi:hypothetical protein
MGLQPVVCVAETISVVGAGGVGGRPLLTVIQLEPRCGRTAQHRAARIAELEGGALVDAELAGVVGSAADLDTVLGQRHQEDISLRRRWGAR